MRNVLVTGASGFIGRRFVELNSNKYNIKTLSLRNNAIDSFDFTGIDCILHLAAKVHEMDKLDEQEYLKVNYELTKQLAQKAIDSHILHFLFVSTVKVYGDDIQAILNELSECNPSDAYGKSKHMAEQYLTSVSSSEFVVSIVRPPMVYGPNGKGNLYKLIQLAAKKFFLPFGKINNQRTIVFVDNLIALLNAVIDNRATGTFIPTDTRAVSTTELLSTIQMRLFNRIKLISIPGFIRSAIRKIKPAVYVRLFGSSEFDNSITRKTLNFIPPYSTEHGLQQTVDWFKQNNK